MPQYTDTQRSEAVTLYIEHGAAEAERQTGITSRSIRRWANIAGVSADRSKQLDQAAAALAVENRERRERIRSKLLATAENVLDRFDQPHIDYRAAGKELHTVQWDTARSGDVKNYAIAFAVLLDKYRLEMGEATGRTETLDLTAAETAVDYEIERLSAEHVAKHA